MSARYLLAEDGECYDEIEAADVAEALDVACENLDEDVYRGGSTCWIDIQATCKETGESDKRTVRIDPEEPGCVDGEDHDWCSPYSVLGGCRENPGVWGHGGGATITTVCRHCGWYQVVDTWAQRQDTGEQGLRSVTYREPDDASRDWVARHQRSV